MASFAEQFRNTSESQKRASSVQATTGPRLSKTDLRYWKERIFKPTYTRGGEQHDSPNWAIYIQHRGLRHKWSLETPNKEAAAAKAKDIFLSLQAKGWEATIQKYRPKMAEKKRNVTVGEFIEAVKTTADLDPKTIEDYCRALRTIVAGAFGLEGGKEKFDYHKGGHKHWLAGINAVRLSALTPARIQEWKRAFLAKAGRSPVAQRRAKVSVNSFIRRARSLFSPDVLQHLSIELPDPLPFAGISFEPRQSLKYQSSFDTVDLIKKARTALAEPEPEQFKIFLLAVMVGLRRREIDLLEWTSFRWDAGIIRIEPTKWFHPKTEDSIGDVPIDPEMIEIFRGYRARTKGEFVIESTREPNPEVTYNHYRCDDCFRKLAEWLRKHGVKTNKPLHTLRKEYGSQINAVHGIRAASRALRHADIRITNEFYTDSRVRVTPGMGHLLKDQPDGDAEAEDKITDLNHHAGQRARETKEKSAVSDRWSFPNRILPNGTWKCGTRDAAILFKPDGSVSLMRGSQSLKADWRSSSGRLGGIDESIQSGAPLDPVVNELLWLHHGGAPIEPAKTSSDYVIIRLVRGGLSSAADIAAEMDISEETVTRRAAGLVKAGYLIKLGTCYMLGSMAGAPPTPEILKSLREITSANDDEAEEKLSEFSRRIKAARALIKNAGGPYDGFFRSLKKLAKDLRRPPKKGELAKELKWKLPRISKICKATCFDWLPTDKPGPKRN